MKNIRILLSLLLVAIPVTLPAAVLQRVAAPARISAVTVYPDRALVLRTADVSLKPGSYLVSFENLPVLLQDDSVRVEGKGAARATIAGLEVKRVFLEESGEQRVKELDEEIRALELRSAALDAKKSGLSAQLAFLESIRVAWGERISKELAIGRPTAAELQDASGLVGSGVTRVAELSLDVDTEKQLLKGKIDALRRQRNDISGSGRKESKSVEVMLDVASPGNLTLELATVIPQASWVPAYDVRLAQDARTAELTFRAMVRQQTGEDWSSVNLTLSTARPAIGSAPPELYPWRIALYRPEPPRPKHVRYKAAAPASMMLEKSQFAADAAAQEAPLMVETAQIGTEQSSVVFNIPRPLDIPSDGSQHGTVVAIEKLAVNMEFQAVPKLSPFVFLKSEISNQTAYPLLPGKVNTFTGNTFTGSSQLKKIAAGEKFDLFFGVDDQVTVKREELKQNREAGIFGSNRVSYGYRIELNSFRKEPITVSLQDQLPLPGDEEIKVSLESPSIKPDEQRADGRISWKMPLKPGEKKELTFGIQVEFPKERELTGL